MERSSYFPEGLPRAGITGSTVLRELVERAAGGDQEAFASLAPSHRKEYVAWIEEAKRSETRQRRIARAVDMIAEGRKLKG